MAISSRVWPFIVLQYGLGVCFCNYRRLVFSPVTFLRSNKCSLEAGLFASKFSIENMQRLFIRLLLNKFTNIGIGKVSSFIAY